VRKILKLRRTGAWARVLLLALLLFRAYVPVGFMPADGAPFALQLCPAAMAGMPAHLHHHPGTHADFESCPFGCVPGAGPISHPIGFQIAGPAPAEPSFAFEVSAPVKRLEPSHPPRGPPSLA
jgi:hypothetical protein